MTSPRRARLPTLPLCMLLLVLPAGFAAGSSDIQTPVGAVTVQDARGDDCAPPLPHVCQASVTGADDPRDADVDVQQRLSYVAVATDLGLVRGPAGDLWVVPDQRQTLYGEDVVVYHPVLVTLTEAWQDVPQDTPLAPYARVEMSEEAILVHHYGPWVWSPTSFDHHTRRVNYSDEQGVGYDRVGPLNAPGGSTTDRWVDSVDLAFCTASVPDCEANGGLVEETWRAWTPNVHFWLSVAEVEVATDPAQLDGPDA